MSIFINIYLPVTVLLLAIPRTGLADCKAIESFNKFEIVCSKIEEKPTPKHANKSRKGSKSKKEDYEKDSIKAFTMSEEESRIMAMNNQLDRQRGKPKPRETSNKSVIEVEVFRSSKRSTI